MRENITTYRLLLIGRIRSCRGVRIRHDLVAEYDRDPELRHSPVRIRETEVESILHLVSKTLQIPQELG